MRFFRKKELIIRRKANYNDPFLQPLAVAIVSAILVALILIMGFLEITRNEKNLLAFMEDQALSTIGVLQRLTEENFKNINAPEQPGSNLKNARKEESSYSKKWVAEAITNLAFNLDGQWKRGGITNDYLSKFAEDNNFLYVGLLNSHGNAVYQSGHLQTNMLDKNDLTRNGKKLSTLELLDLIEKSRVKRKKTPGGFVGISRRDKSGTVVISLDEKGIIYWTLKVAGEKGMNKIGEGHGIIYMQIINNQNKLLSSVGQKAPNLTNNYLIFKNILAGKIRIASSKVNYDENKILDLAAPLFLDKKIVGIVRIGLDRRSMDKSLAQNRQQIFVFSLSLYYPCGSFIMTRTATWPALWKWKDNWKKLKGYLR
jgi:hypothetical protein